MKICAREFAKDLIALGDREQVSARLVVNRLEDLRETLGSSKALALKTKWNITFDEVLPVEAIRSSIMEKVQNFARLRL